MLRPWAFPHATRTTRTARHGAGTELSKGRVAHRGKQAVRFDFSAGDVDGSKECTLENDGAR